MSRHNEAIDQIAPVQAPSTLFPGEKGPGCRGPGQVFTPDSGWTWWASEFEGEDLFFGLAHGAEKERGYFRLPELKEIRGVLGLPEERDRYYRPKTLCELME